MGKQVKTSATLFTFVALVVAVPLLVRALSAGEANTPDADMDLVTAYSLVPTSELAPALLRAGLSSDALAAAGVSSTSVSRIVFDFATAMAAEPNRLSSADASRANARRTSDRLKRLIQSGRGTAQDVTDYQTAVADRATAKTGTDSCLQAFCDAGVAGATGPQTALLATIHANRAWHFPTEFLTVNRTEVQWVQLRDALDNERVSLADGETPDAAMQTQLTTWRADSTVSTAKTNLDANLTAVQVAWNAAVGL